jgi:hypothetical protein
MRENSYMASETGVKRDKEWHFDPFSEDFGGYASVALKYIEIIRSGVGDSMILCVPNNGALSMLEDTDVVEMTCDITPEGAYPHRYTVFDDDALELIRRMKRYERMAAKAILTKDRDLAVSALMLHPLVESYSLAQQILGDRWIAFDADQAAVEQARKVSDCLILLDPGKDSAEGTVVRLKGIGGWCGMSTMKYNMLDAHYIRTVREAGFEVQASIFPAPHEQRAVHDAVSIQLSDFWWFQTPGRKPAWKRREKVNLSAGASHSLSLESPAEFAALTLRLSFSGTLEVTLTDWRATKTGWQKVPVTYTLHRDTPGEEVIGLRLYKSAPEIKITAAEGPVAVNVKTTGYRIF